MKVTGWMLLSALALSFTIEARESVDFRDYRRGQYQDQRYGERTALRRRPVIHNQQPDHHQAYFQEYDNVNPDDSITVAVGPPSMRYKYGANNKPKPESISQQNAMEFVKNIFQELGREFLTHKISEDFVFGQYVGNVMTKLTSPLKLKMQQDILELIARYQIGENVAVNKDANTTNEAKESWHELNNLAKIVSNAM